METHSLILIQKDLKQIVKSFIGLESYKLEYGLWDHETVPQLTIYVAIYFAGTHHSIHSRKPTIQESFKEILDWYTEKVSTQLKPSLVS
jgi:hypothetical protein